MPLEILKNIKIKPISSIEEAFQEALIGYDGEEENSTNKKSAIDKYENKIVIESEVIT